MCDQCNDHKNLQEILQEIVPQIRREMHAWLVLSDRVQAADDETLGRAIFNHQHSLPKEWPKLISALNRLL